MIISVVLEGALKNGYKAVVPLDVDDIEPDVESIVCACRKEVDMIYPFEKASDDFVVSSMQSIVEKIKKLRRRQC